MDRRLISLRSLVLVALTMLLVAGTSPMPPRGVIAQESSLPPVDSALLDAALAAFAPFADMVPDDAIPSQSVFLRFEDEQGDPLGSFSAMGPGGIVWDGFDDLEFAQVYNAAGDRLYLIDLRTGSLLVVADPGASSGDDPVRGPTPTDLQETAALLQAFVSADTQGRVIRDRVQLNEPIFEATIRRLRDILSVNPERFECHLCREAFGDAQGRVVGDILYRPIVGIQLSEQGYDEGFGRQWRINQNSGEIMVARQIVVLDAAVPPWYDHDAFLLYVMPTEADRAIIEHLLQAFVTSA